MSQKCLLYFDNVFVKGYQRAYVCGNCNEAFDIFNEEKCENPLKECYKFCPHCGIKIKQVVVEDENIVLRVRCADE